MQYEETAYWLNDIMPAQLELRRVDGHRVGTATLDDARALAATVEFGGVDTGLALSDDPEREVRCELMVTATATEAEAAAVALAAGRMLEEAGGVVPAQPGVLLPGLAERAGLVDATVTHGMLQPPRLWGEQTPHVNEDDRMTLMLEVIMITDEEYDIAVDQGVDKLLRRLQRRAADLDDWGREL